MWTINAQKTKVTPNYYTSNAHMLFIPLKSLVSSCHYPSAFLLNCFVKCRDQNWQALETLLVFHMSSHPCLVLASSFFDRSSPFHYGVCCLPLFVLFPHTVWGKDSTCSSWGSVPYLMVYSQKLVDRLRFQNPLRENTTNSPFLSMAW